MISKKQLNIAVEEESVFYKRCKEFGPTQTIKQAYEYAGNFLDLMDPEILMDVHDNDLDEVIQELFQFNANGALANLYFYYRNNEIIYTKQWKKLENHMKGELPSDDQ